MPPRVGTVISLTSMEMGMLNFRTGPFYAKWAADWRDAQNQQGDVPYTAPYSQDAGGGPVWSGFCITMPWQIYLTYGDRRPLELGWPVMKKWLAFIETQMGDGLLQPYVRIGCAGSPEWNFLGDWVPPGRKQGKDRVDDRSTLFFNNCYLVYCLQLAGKIGRVVGDIRGDEQAPGFQHFIASPGVESGLKRVNASLTTGYGRIASAWRVEGDTLNWELTVPPNTTATVVIPATGLDAVRESGLPVAAQPGIARSTVENGLFRGDVASGAYRFTSRLPSK